MIAEANTTIASWAIAIKDALAKYPVDIDDIFQQAGITEAQLSDPLNRIASNAMFKLWQTSVALTQDETLGLQVSLHITPSTFFVMGIAALTSQNALEALQLGANFSSLMSQGVELRVAQAGEQFFLEIGSKPGFAEFHSSSVHAGFATLIRLGRQYLGLNVPLDKISFTHPEPENPQVFAEWFGCPLEFNADRNAIYSSHVAELTRSLPMANTALRAINEQLLNDYVSQLANRSISSRVNNELTARVENGECTDQRIIARSVAMSERKLQTCLKEEGTSFQDMLDAIRQRKAIFLLSVKKQPVSQVALQLGFKEVSSFTRAFKRWTGKSPRAYLIG